MAVSASRLGAPHREAESACRHATQATAYATCARISTFPGFRFRKPAAAQFFHGNT